MNRRAPPLWSNFQIMWVDVVFFNMLQGVASFGVSVDLSKFPKCKGVYDGVAKNPRIAAWIAKRPDTKM